MKKRFKWIGILGMLSVFILGGLIEASADEYRHRERKRHSGEDDSAKKIGLTGHEKQVMTKLKY